MREIRWKPGGAAKTSRGTCGATSRREAPSATSVDRVRREEQPTEPGLDGEPPRPTNNRDLE